MPTVAIQLDPSRLTNPDLDIRYVLPDQLEEDSASAVSDDGYDYGRTSDRLTLFLRTADLAAAVPIVLGRVINQFRWCDGVATAQANHTMDATR